MLSKRMKGIRPSPTLGFSARAKELKRNGVDIIDFSVGEPDFDTPENVRNAAIQAIRDGFTHYTASNGIPELREAIARKFEEDHGVHYEPDEIIVSTGGKQSLYNIAMALFGPGDEILVPTPCWVSYIPQVELAEAKPIAIHTSPEEGFLLSPEQLERSITANTKAIIINNPNNPTGAAYEAARLRSLAEVLERHGVFVISDEIYEKLVYDDFVFTSFAALGPSWKEKCVIVGGVSKSHAMTGWRIGYAAGPRELIEAMGRIQGHSTSNANSIAQKAALEALAGDQSSVEMMRKRFEARRDLMYNLLLEIPSVRCVKPKGAFYLFPDWSAYIGARRRDGGTIESSADLAEYLLEEARVAVVPGTAFGGPEGTVRFSYASSEDDIRRGIGRVAEAAAKLVLS